ncbi:MAG: PorT family protein [Balneolales bacterium]|nr:PorT family protein [Balneolales bacterium]
MNKYWIVTLLLACAVLFFSHKEASAQFQGLEINQTSGFGVKAGFTAYQISSSLGSETESSDLRLGWTIGVFGHIPLTDAISFQPELLFAQKGGSGSEAGFNGEIILNYIDVPLLVRYTFPIDAAVLPSVTGGPVVGFLAGATGKASGNGNSSSTDISDAYKSVNFGLSLGVGLQLDRFNLDYRYEFGLANISDLDLPSDVGNVDFSQKNRGFTVSLGYRF